jgi:hypothetical protein
MDLISGENLTELLESIGLRGKQILTLWNQEQETDMVTEGGDLRLLDDGSLLGCSAV